MTESGRQGVRQVDDEAGLTDALAVREAVFVDEQGVPPDRERDQYDELGATADHFVAYDADEPVGAARLREHAPGVGKVERVAVLPARRGEGWGVRLMEAVEARARERRFDALVLHAQTPVEEFYRERGYETTSDRFDEAGIPHVEMRKSL